MPTPKQTPEKPKLTPKENALATVAMALFFNGKMTDEFLPPDQYAIFVEKPFQEWPKELQDKLRPFGAEMIQ